MFWEVISSVLIAVIALSAVYGVTRIATAAYFRSKADYIRRMFKDETQDR